MPFSFNFQVDSESTSDLGDSNLDSEEKSPVTWKSCKEHFIEDCHLEKIVSTEKIDTYTVDGGETLNIVNSEGVGQQLTEAGYKGDLSPALATNKSASDLVAGQYEGGLKIWECSQDLVSHLSLNTADGLQGKKVLELGCGAALPGVLAFKHGASVWFNDYNEDVIKEITIPNVLLNVPSTKETVTRFFSGDWKSFEENFLLKELTEESWKFDLILTSETIYNVENQSKLVSIFKNCLKREGEVLVAAKTFYFGVGGGLRQFENLVKQENLKSEIVKTFDNSGVKREIMKITR